MPIDKGHDFDKITTALETATHEEIMLLTSLKDLVNSGEERLDRILGAIADAARRVTGGSGAALAMWKEGVMVCRARSGDMAPALGARLDTSSGISGECLRTGLAQHCSDTENNALVDVEVCRSLGLRSIAVLPIRGWREINGILEVFSPVPAAFSPHQLRLLDEFAALAERARTSQPLGASQAPVPRAAAATVRKPAGDARPSRILPASDAVRDVALAVVGGRSRRFVLAAIGVAALVLASLAIWLGWRGADENGNNAHAASPSSVAATVSSRQLGGHLPDNDPVWRPNPGGEPLYPSRGKPTVGSSVTYASKKDVIELQTGADIGDAAQATAPRRSTPRAATMPPVQVMRSLAESIEPPSMPGELADSASLNGVLTAKATPPSLFTPTSQGITGGQLLHRVPPVYPAQAKRMRVGGRVVLNAMVGEDGSIGDLTVVTGPRELAQSAMEAVKQWRYQPFLLDGKPIKRETTITIDFKL